MKSGRGLNAPLTLNRTPLRPPGPEDRPRLPRQPARARRGGAVSSPGAGGAGSAHARPLSDPPCRSRRLLPTRRIRRRQRSPCSRHPLGPIQSWRRGPLTPASPASSRRRPSLRRGRPVRRLPFRCHPSRGSIGSGDRRQAGIGRTPPGPCPGLVRSPGPNPAMVRPPGPCPAWVRPPGPFPARGVARQDRGAGPAMGGRAAARGLPCAVC